MIEDGYMKTDGILMKPLINGTILETDGASEEGWIIDDEVWYYLEEGIYTVGWKEILSEDGNSYWFYFW